MSTPSAGAAVRVPIAALSSLIIRAVINTCRAISHQTTATSQRNPLDRDDSRGGLLSASHIVDVAAFLVLEWRDPAGKMPIAEPRSRRLLGNTCSASQSSRSRIIAAVTPSDR